MNLKLVRRAPVGAAIELSEEQISVRDFRGRALVTGAAGSGKTTTLIHSVIARQSEIKADEILVLTYGRESANDLRDRIAISMGSTTSEPLVRTFHSLAFAILNDSVNPEDEPFTLLSGAEHDAELAAALAEFGPSIWSPELQKASGTKTFVREVRDVLMRATENGWDSKTLASFNDEPYWKEIAKFWELLEKNPKRINSSEIIVRAINVLEDENQLAKWRGRYKSILVDEFQESDAMQRRLLELIAPDDTILFFDEASTVGQFRGATPNGVREWAKSYQEFRLNQLQRPIASVEHAKLRSISEQSDFIAQSLRRAHIEEGIAWSEMAIIVRSPGQIVQALQRSFSINHIPLTIDTQALALKENPAVKPLLEIALFSLDPSLLVPSQWGRIEAILTSDFVGADRLELRQMRMALAKERDENNRENQDDSRTTTEIMIDVIKDPTHTSLVDVKALERLRDLLVAARKANKSRNVSDLLWAIWDNARQANGEKVATAWREKALKGGARGAAADRDLDAIINLFDSAKRFVDRNPGLDSKAFIDYMFTQRFAADAISFEAQREDSVTLKTVHSAKGLEWELVVIPNLQQGQWPNMKERGSLLGSERITERVFSQINVKQVLDSSTTSKLAQDEKRLFESAKRRARSRVILTAIEAEDLFPSTYFFESADEKSLKDFKPQRGLNSHILIAQLRDDLLNPEKRDFAARLLNKVASQGMSAADPDQWLGALEPSTNAPVVRPHEDIYVSPSSIQSFEDCALKWFLEKSGAQDGDSSAQLLGVAIHKLAAMVHEDKTLDVTRAKKRLLESWKVVDQSIGWFKEAELNRASEMLDAFFNWHATQGNELVKVEENFEVKIHDRVVLHGQVDRLEKDSDGNIFIVDIKTGATITKPEAEKNRQMNAYQVAANEGGFKEQTGSTSSSGSALLYVGDTPASVRPQAPVTDPDVKEGIVETGLKMGSNNFVAVINKNCRTCRVSHICPLQAEGRSVID